MSSRRSSAVFALAIAAITAAVPAAPAGTAEPTGVFVIAVTIGGTCGPEQLRDRDGADDARPAPFDAYIRVRNRDTGELRIVRSGKDGRIRRRFPVGRYRIRGGKPHDGYGYTKAVVYRALSRDETERIRIGYDNGCR